MSSLFDEDSSSDEELTKSQPAPTKQKIIDDDDDDEKMLADDAEDTPKRTIEVDEEDDDDDDDEPAKTPSTKEKADDDDDDADGEETDKNKVVYNPDEEDVEYDGDRDGIVGSAAPIKPPSAPKVRRPKKMTVMESTRPPKDTTLHITKLPNLVGIQPEPFDEAAYSPELEEKEYNGYVHNMIRWRYKKDASGNFVRNDAGKLMRESNARLVKWDDGSITLNIGSEVLAVDSLETAPGGYPGLNGYLYLSQKATFPTENGDDDEEAGGTVLECMGGITSKFTARPSSLQSDAHKALTVAVRQKTVKRAKIAEYVTQEDPEKMKEEKIRLNTDLSKSEARKSAGRNYGGGGRSSRPGMNRRYMEDEDDGHYDSVNIKELKRRQFADDEVMDYGDDDSDEDDDDDDVGWSSKGKLAAMRASKKRQRQEEDDDEEEEFGAGDESDEEEVARVNKPTKKRQTNLFDDDDD
mmetsp:Transcript_30231/g.49946  ORF Transcript_30231/g.49946 Transcript_30231/m.49946 type:complete len:466 (-) Transcript_30231:906-2303(-)